ncbi:DUF4124 domain-containing protein [Massilia sp. H-1]|nr:DUF4124 domain-containing protein [Massilia sp. H-1]
MQNKLPHSLAAAVLLLSVTGTAHAQLYKWVDAQGKTHYSNKADAAGNAKVKELQVDTAPTATPSQIRQHPGLEKTGRGVPQAPGGRQLGAHTERSVEPFTSGRLPQRQGRNGRQPLPPGARHPERRRAWHSGGAPTDSNDREIAQRDVGAFCR